MISETMNVTPERHFLSSSSAKLALRAVSLLKPRDSLDGAERAALLRLGAFLRSASSSGATVPSLSESLLGSPEAAAYFREVLGALTREESAAKGVVGSDEVAPAPSSSGKGGARPSPPSPLARPSESLSTVLTTTTPPARDQPASPLSGSGAFSSLARSEGPSEPERTEARGRRPDGKRPRVARGAPDEGRVQERAQERAQERRRRDRDHGDDDDEEEEEERLGVVELRSGPAKRASLSGESQGLFPLPARAPGEQDAHLGRLGHFAPPQASDPAASTRSGSLLLAALLPRGSPAPEDADADAERPDLDVSLWRIGGRRAAFMRVNEPAVSPRDGGAAAARPSERELILRIEREERVQEEATLFAKRAEGRSTGATDRGATATLAAPGPSAPVAATVETSPASSAMASSAPASSAVLCGAFSPPSTLEDALSRCEDWSSFDAESLGRLSGGRPLSTLTLHLVRRRGIVRALGLDERALARWLRAVERAYEPNPYHCALHAADVVQAVACMLAADGLYARLSPLEALALLLGAAAHDLGHPGLRNDFLVRAHAPEAILYNDASVNENRHAALAFDLYHRPGNAFFPTSTRARGDLADWLAAGGAPPAVWEDAKGPRLADAVLAAANGCPHAANLEARKRRARDAQRAREERQKRGEANGGGGGGGGASRGAALREPSCLSPDGGADLDAAELVSPRLGSSDDRRSGAPGRGARAADGHASARAGADADGDGDGDGGDEDGDVSIAAPGGRAGVAPSGSSSSASPDRRPRPAEVAGAATSPASASASAETDRSREGGGPALPAAACPAATPSAAPPSAVELSRRVRQHVDGLARRIEAHRLELERQGEAAGNPDAAGDAGAARNAASAASPSALSPSSAWAPGFPGSCASSAPPSAPPHRCLVNGPACYRIFRGLVIAEILDTDCDVHGDLVALSSEVLDRRDRYWRDARDRPEADEACDACRDEIRRVEVWERERELQERRQSGVAPEGAPADASGASGKEAPADASGVAPEGAPADGSGVAPEEAFRSPLPPPFPFPFAPSAPPFPPDCSFEERASVLGLLLHVADISNPARPLRTCVAWAEALREELITVQGAKETALGMPHVCDATDPAKNVLPRNQVCFIQRLLQPTLDLATRVTPRWVAQAQPRVSAALRYWTQRAAERNA